MSSTRSYKKASGFENVALYESKIDINYQVVGRPEWFDEYFDPGTIPQDQQIIISSPVDLEPIMENMDRFQEHGLDTETGGAFKEDGLNPISDTSKVLLLQWGVPECIYLIDPELIPFIKSRIGSDKALIIGQSLLFDYKFILHKYNIRLGGDTARLYDTMLAEQVARAGLPGVRVGLRDLAMTYPPHYIICKTVRESFVNFTEGSKITRDMLYYAARDIFLLFHIRRGQQPRINNYKLDKIVGDEFSVLPVTVEMEGVVEKEYRDRGAVTGIFLDSDILRLSIIPYIARQKEIEDEVIKIYNEALELKGRSQLTIMPVIDSFDLDSPSQKLKALEVMGIKVKDTKRETLAALDAKVAKLLAEYTECTKITSTYGEGLLSKRQPNTGTNMPRMEQMGSGDTLQSTKRAPGHGTSTGRYTSDFQQMPRPEDVRIQLTDEELKEAERFADKYVGVPLEDYGS